MISEEEIKAAIIKVASEYSKAYENEQLTIVADLSNTFIFVADLIRELQIDTTIQFIVRDGTQKPNSLIDLGLNESLKGKNVLIVADVYYKGNTLKRINDIVTSENPKDIKLLTLVDKKSKEREFELEINALFKIEDIYIVGYGLTHNGSYRGLKGIYSINLEEEK
ncbi:hypoxanthine-guanine phosphoribosyltransferase [Spiroplasma clarkii]|nr:hypoxanthine-guanine phosphoribosyltransferase [Spiroplasma clarkii]